MEVADLLTPLSLFWTPITVAALAGLAVMFIWLALAPAAPQRQVRDRLSEYLERGDIVMDEDFQRSFVARAIWPVFRGVLRFLGRLLPTRNMERTRQQLEHAGNPGGLSVLDYYGIRVLLIIVLVGGAALLMRSNPSQGLLGGLRGVALAGLIGYVLPVYWLRGRVRRRRNSVIRALPDALDMLTIGVEAGLAFESAMLRVGEKWDNELTHEFRRAVAEMRVGMSRETALTRMAERCDAPDLHSFVGVLVQSSQLGVSIASVLHSQADQMRERRRQRAEELARQAGIKMLIPLVFLIFPAIFVVILGPSVPRILATFRGMGGP
jgi:tight adherence protein C